MYMMLKNVYKKCILDVIQLSGGGWRVAIGKAPSGAFLLCEIRGAIYAPTPLCVDFEDDANILMRKECQ